MNDATLTCSYENSDEPTCPVCGGYNAMLWDSSVSSSSVSSEGRDHRDHRKCRDCGAKAVLVPVADTGGPS